MVASHACIVTRPPCAYLFSGRWEKKTRLVMLASCLTIAISTSKSLCDNSHVRKCAATLVPSDDNRFLFVPLPHPCRCVNLDDFDSTRTLALIPPDGEFVVMNYRVTSEFRPPFRIFPALEEASPYKIELVLKVGRSIHMVRCRSYEYLARLSPSSPSVNNTFTAACLPYFFQIRADIPESNYGSNVIVRFPVPKNSATVTPELGPGALAPATRGVAAAVGAGAAAPPQSGQLVEYVQKDREVVWQIKKFQGQAEHVLRVRISLSSPSTSNIRKEVGPISMSFEIPMFNTSNLQVRSSCVR